MDNVSALFLVCSAFLFAALTVALIKLKHVQNLRTRDINRTSAWADRYSTNISALHTEIDRRETLLSELQLKVATGEARMSIWDNAMKLACARNIPMRDAVEDVRAARKSVEAVG